MKKILGKYYFEKLTDEEYAKNAKTNFHVFTEKGEKNAVDFALRLKAKSGKDLEGCTV